MIQLSSNWILGYFRFKLKINQLKALRYIIFITSSLAVTSLFLQVECKPMKVNVLCEDTFSKKLWNGTGAWVIKYDVV